MPVWVELLGGSGILAVLSGIVAVFIRIGRVLEKLDDLEEWRISVDRFGRDLLTGAIQLPERRYRQRGW